MSRNGILVSTVKRRALAARVQPEERREQFVEVAREAFCRKGYGDTSMSEIAALVGGSKTTLWSYFHNKEDLFAAVCDAMVERYGCAVTIELDEMAPIGVQLRCFGHALLDTILSPPIVALQRMVIGEAGRFPELARLFYERGPARGKARLAALLKQAMDSGSLKRGDPQLAAKQLVSLLQAQCWQPLLLGLNPAPAPERRAEEVETAVETFLCCWAQPLS